jgi:hypothetical protein
MANAVQDVKSSGILSRKTSSAAGPAYEFSSASTISAAGVVSKVSNNGTTVNAILGDGSSTHPILTAPPAAPVIGQMWLEKIGAVTYLAFVDHLAVINYLATGAPSPVTPTAVPTPIGTTAIDSFLVDSVGVIDWAAGIENTDGRRATYSLSAVHNGTTVADATNASLDILGKACIGVPDVTFSVALAGSGAGQTLTLQATTTQANWTVYIVRENLVAV